MGLLYAIAAAITWGLVYTLDQKILLTASPFALVFIDSLLTTALLLPFIIIQRPALISLASTQSRIWVLIIASLALAALANFFIFSSIRLLGASTASIFEIAYPFFVVLFSYFAFGANLNRFFLLGAILIFVGAAIIIRLA